MSGSSFSLLSFPLCLKIYHLNLFVFKLHFAIYFNKHMVQLVFKACLRGDNVWEFTMTSQLPVSSDMVYRH